MKRLLTGALVALLLLPCAFAERHHHPKASGDVTAGQITLSSASIAFGRVTVGEISLAELNITNTGTVPVTLSDITVTDVTDFSFPVIWPDTFDPGQSLLLVVGFIPVSAGAKAATVTITGSNASATLTLTGTGVVDTDPWTVNLTWDAPVTTPVPIAGYNVYRAEGSGPFVLLGTTAADVLAWSDKAPVGSTWLYEVASVDAAGSESAPTNVVTVTTEAP